MYRSIVDVDIVKESIKNQQTAYVKRILLQITNIAISRNVFLDLIFSNVIGDFEISAALDDE